MNRALFPLFLFASVAAHAANGTWTQVTTGGLWSNPANWSAGAIADGTGATAIFDTLDLKADNTVLLNSPRTLTTLRFGDKTTSNGWTLSNNGLATNTLTLAGSSPSIVTAAPVTIKATIAGSSGWTKLGDGMLTLSGANTFTGTLRITNGTAIARSSNSAFGAGTAAVIVQSTGSRADGGQVVLHGNGGSLTITKDFLIQGPGETASATAAALLAQQGAVTTSGRITLDGTGVYRLHERANSTPDASWRINGDIVRSGANSGGLVFLVEGATDNSTTETQIVCDGLIDNNGGPLTVTGSNLGTLILAKAGSDLGPVTLNGAYTAGDASTRTTIRLGANDALTPGKDLILSKGSLDLAGWNQSVNSLSGTADASLITNSASGTTSILTLGSGNGDGVTFAGVIENGKGLVQVVKTGSGTQWLTGPNTYSGGTVVRAGVLGVSASAAFGNPSKPLTLDGGGLGIWGTDLANLASLGRPVVFTSGKSTAFEIADQNGVFTIERPMNLGSGGLRKLGAGALVLTQENAVAGAVTVTEGELRLAHLNALPNSVVTVEDGTLTFGLAGSNTYLLGGIAGRGRVMLEGNSIQIGGSGASSDFAGTISGWGGVVKSGTGSLSLTGGNNFTGPLTVAQGSVVLASGCLSRASRIIVASGATVNLSGALVKVSTSALTFKGVAEPNGTYGALGSGASKTRAYLTGSGRLVVGPEDLAQQDADFFKLLNFKNPSLIKNNVLFGPLATELEKTSTDYVNDLGMFWSRWSSHPYSTGPSVELAESAAFAQTFFDWINLDAPGLGGVKALVNAGRYSDALNAWRDVTVDRFRRMKLPEIYQLADKSRTPHVRMAQYLLGEINNSDYYGDPANGFYFIDIYGIGGTRGKSPPINWLGNQSLVNAKTHSLSEYWYTGFTFAHPLLYRYHTGAAIPGGAGSALTLSGSGTRVVASFGAPHGLKSGDYIQVSSAAPQEYNGIFKATVLDSTRASYQTAIPVTAVLGSGTSRKAVRTREPEAIAKWFSIVADFCTNQKNAVAAKKFEENPAIKAAYPTIIDASDWSVTPGSALGLAGEVSELTAALGLWCKLLPDAAPVVRDWETQASLPNNAALAAGAAQIIPSEQLARICLSLVADHPETLLLAYLKPGTAPNQRLAGLKALYLDASVFSEFKSSPGLRAVDDTALGNYSNETFYPEGAMLERSPNYNLGDSRSVRTLVDLALDFGEALTPGVAAMQTKVLLYDRVNAYMQRPTGGLPRMASYAGPTLPELWLGDSVISDYRSKFLQDPFLDAKDPEALKVYHSLLDSGEPVPAATSVAFPYAGYYMMRNGWQTKAHYLYFANTPIGRGHAQRDENGIQLTAFGRELLTCGGIPPYNLSFVDPSQKADYEGFAQFLGETSSYKCNTVVVDGRSQSNDLHSEPTTSNSVRSNPWFTSAEFDYLEGTYAMSYGGGKYGGGPAYSPLLPNGETNTTITGITHKRAAIFLRHAGLWLLVDRMSSGTTAHTYRQIWNFPAKDDPAAPLGKSGLNGFLPSEVTANATTQTIRTTASGPNIALYHLGPGPVKYETFSGSRSPYAGWYGISSFGGLRLPTKNVHAVFSGSGTTTLVTVLAPRDTGSSGPVTGERFVNGPLASTTVVDRTFALADGTSARFVQAPTAQTLQLGNRTIAAATVLVVTYGDGGQRGLALDSTTSGLPSAFAFAAAPGAFVAESSITTPAGFDWDTITSPPNTAPVLSPIAALTMNENTTSAPLPFLTSDLQRDPSAVNVTATTSNATLIPVSGVVIRGNTIARTVTVTPAPNQTGSATITIIARDGITATSKSFVVTVNPDAPVAPLAKWQQASFGSDWQNAAVSGDLADPDHDGVSNLLEYFLNTQPTMANGEVTSLKRSGDVLIFTYPRNKSAKDVTGVPEWSDTLLPNSWSTSDVSTPTVVSDNGLTQILAVTLPVGTSGQRFVRLHVTR